jgi:hypothetical protein
MDVKNVYNIEPSQGKLKKDEILRRKKFCCIKDITLHNKEPSKGKL